MLWSRSLQITDSVIKLGEFKKYLMKRHFINVWHGVEKTIWGSVVMFCYVTVLNNLSKF